MNHMEIRFSASLQNEAFARTAVASFVSSINPTMEEIVEIKTIISEAVSNAIIHGYRMDAGRDIYIRAFLRNRELEVIIQDYGIGISKIEEISQGIYTQKDGSEHSGMGITIMKTLSDSFDIRSTIGIGTKVTIKKEFAPVKEEVHG